MLTGTTLACSRLRAGVEEFLLRPRPLGLLLGGSLVCAVAFCLFMFDLAFVTGASAYWRAPQGLVGHSWADISQTLSGYNYFVTDDWRLPLFQTSKLGVPDPVNIIFTDSIPIVAICGRLLYRATGLTPNLYGAWTVFCFIASAVSLTGLVAAMGQRGIAAAMMATACALCMPALLHRWGHMSLMAQWELVVALVIYVRSRSTERTKSLFAASLLLAAFTLWTHSYLFVMVVAILAATLAQAIIDKRIRVFAAMSAAALFGVTMIGLVFISGHLSSEGPLVADGFGAFSMNLLSPIFPQLSGIFPAMREILVDGTGGQYEGFSYFGAGALFLVLMLLPDLRRGAASAWRAHLCMIALLAAFAVFAVSNQIYVGPWRVLTVPLPASIFDIASMFRSSGRFFWPSLYLLTALAIVAVPHLRGRSGVWLLLFATVIQIADSAPLRSALAARVSAPAANHLDARWEEAIREHEFVFVTPAYGCGTGQYAKEIAVELQLLASRANVPTNTVYASRDRGNCGRPEPASAAGKELQVYVLWDPGTVMPSDPALRCAASGTLGVCSGQLDPGQLTALLEGVTSAPLFDEPVVGTSRQDR